MNDEDREQYEENRGYLIDTARRYKVTLEVVDDQIRIKDGSLWQFVEFYQDWRSEIEEML